jgi:hypothetical protein
MSIPTKNWFRISLGFIGGFALVLATGCASKSAAINGKVTFEGKPLTGGSVIVYCQDQQIVRGIIDSDGNYTIPNVPKGSATVTVHCHTPIPAGFQLSQTLPPVTNGPVPPAVDVSKPGTVIIIPERYNLPEESGLALTVDRCSQVFNIDLMP